MASEARPAGWLTLSRVLLLLAVLCALLAVFHAPVPVVDLIALSLAFGWASRL